MTANYFWWMNLWMYVMPISKMEFKSAKEIEAFKKSIYPKLEKLGRSLNLSSGRGVRTESGRMDFVWYHDLPNSIQGIDRRIPVMDFEIEAGFSSRKYLKGDIVNLLELSPAYGVILFLKALKIQTNFRIQKYWCMILQTILNLH
jgi:hypothetical protein